MKDICEVSPLISSVIVVESSVLVTIIRPHVNMNCGLTYLNHQITQNYK